MNRKVKFSFQSGTEAAIPAGDRPRLRSGRGAGRQMRTFEPVAVDFKATAGEAERIVSAWRVLDVELNAAKVRNHLEVLTKWHENQKIGRKIDGIKESDG